jgi:hypothetical protein
MSDMTAFERELSGEITGLMGPEHPVDDAAIFTAITTNQSPKWRFQSMFSATKFVVAGAIVALFGGFLLTGVLTQQPSDEPLPAVGASASASPRDLDSEAMTPSVFAIKLTGWGANGAWGQRYTEDPDTGHRTITRLLPDTRKGRALLTEAADGPMSIDASDVDPRALGTLTVVQAKGDEMLTEDGRFFVWTERSWIRLENDDGAWVGTASTHALGDGVAFGWASWELTGEGDYEGLTMFLQGVQGDGRLHGEPWLAPSVLVGVIVPSGSVPAYPPPVDIGAE